MSTTNICEQPHVLHNLKYPSGVTHQKIQPAKRNTQAIYSYIRDICMTREAKHDISVFNEILKDQMNLLASSCQTRSDITVSISVRGHECLGNKTKMAFQNWPKNTNTVSEIHQN
jgi:hypothetical protein